MSKMEGVFKGSDGLGKLLDADEFWESQPYGTRLYFGDGIADYLHRDVLRCAVYDLQNEEQKQSEIERLRDKQTEQIMPMIGPLLDAFEAHKNDLAEISPELVKWLKNINQVMIGNECPECNGSGMRDSGGFYPWGEGINVPCGCGAEEK